MIGLHSTCSCPTPHIGKCAAAEAIRGPGDLCAGPHKEYYCLDSDGHGIIDAKGAIYMLKFHNHVFSGGSHTQDQTADCRCRATSRNDKV
jgi:hypothetical protein